jgi:hypothetical protein
MPSAVSNASLRLSYQPSYYCFWSKDQRVPPSQNSRTMAKWGGLVQAPKNMTMLGCRRAYMAWH